MQPHPSTTPFGGRPLSLAMVASQSIAKACPAGAAVHKWEVFRALCEGRAAFGLSERSLAVLNALLTFHPETVLTAAGDLVVFPSNVQLALRAHGMAASTLRRNLAVLVDAGVLIRRDSPNGKRYQRAAGEDGDKLAFGFDLMPLVARAAEFEARAREVREERRIVVRLRERITIARRDVAKMCSVAREEEIPGRWTEISAGYADFVARLPRLATSCALRPLVMEIEHLSAIAAIMLKKHVDLDKTTVNESRSEHHIQNSKTDEFLHLELAADEDEGIDGGRPESRKPPSRLFPLPMVLDACPDIVDYSRGGIASWRDLCAAADIARAALGVSPSAWLDAEETMGREVAAVVVAAILQKTSSIGNAGAYVRSLTAKSREGAFSPGPMLMALLRIRSRAKMRA